MLLNEEIMRVAVYNEPGSLYCFAASSSTSTQSFLIPNAGGVNQCVFAALNEKNFSVSPVRGLNHHALISFAFISAVFISIFLPTGR